MEAGCCPVEFLGGWLGHESDLWPCLWVEQFYHSKYQPVVVSTFGLFYLFIYLFAEPTC